MLDVSVYLLAVVFVFVFGIKWLLCSGFLFYQAEDGIRSAHYVLEFRRVLFRSTSDSSVASAGVRTRRPSSSAFARLFEPGCRPMRTSTPESRRFSAWAWPWLP